MAWRAVRDHNRRESAALSAAPSPSVSRRGFLRGAAALGVSLFGLGYTGPAAAREILTDWGPGASGEPLPGLAGLLHYLAVDRDTFERYEAAYFSGLGDLLAAAGAVDAAFAVDPSSYRGAVLRFQESHALPVTGRPDEDTLWALQAGRAVSNQLDLVEVEADLWPGRSGVQSMVLREDAAGAYNRLRAAVNALGGVVTSDGSMRDLTAEVSAARSAMSLHYTGLAFDLATMTGMQDPATDPYVATREGPGWHVWARATHGVERALDAAVWRNGATSTEPVTAKVLDFTGMALSHGFRDIGFRGCFPGSYSCAEWWHFNYEAALVPFVSQFGIELLRLKGHTEPRLSAYSPIWENRKAIRHRGRRGWVSTPGPER